MRNSTKSESGKRDREKDAGDENHKASPKKSPSKMGDKSPQKEEKQQQRSGKGFTCEVVLLDGEHVNIELDRNADGKDLFEKVCQHLDLIEKDYFGLQYVDERIPQPLKCWLSPEKKISKQKKRGPWLFDFSLKFYPPDPTQLRESLTRWLVTLQTRRDILSGKLPATFLTQAMLGSYCVQADIGDYDSTEHHGIDYIKSIPFAPNQTEELLEKIVELHRQHKGQTPDEAEINFLENAKKLSMYGVDLHEAQDVNNVDIMLGVCASGLQVYRDKLRISRFVWPKILKISYKRKHFYIKVRPADNSHLENTVSFKLKSHRLAKRLWKICVEHHAFFRLREAEQPQNTAVFPRLGSKFRYSGRTLYQARHSSQNLDRPDPYFERSQPARNTYAAPSNRSQSVDELTNRPDYWKDDMDIDVKKRPTEGREGRDRRDHMGQPTVISMLGLPEGMKPVEGEESMVEPGPDQSMDGKDRQDYKPEDSDATLEKPGVQDTMGLTPAELQKKAKEDEKERKKREKEEEKRRKKEEEERKKAEKAAKKGKGKAKTPSDPTAEDRTDLKDGKDNTERAPEWTAGVAGDQEGDPLRMVQAAPVGSAPGDKERGPEGGDWRPGQEAAGRELWAPEKEGPQSAEDQWEPVEMRDKARTQNFAPERDDRQWEPDNKDDRFSTFRDPGKDGGDKDRWTFGKDRDSREPGSPRDEQYRGAGENPNLFVPAVTDLYSPSTAGDRDRWEPGRDGEQQGDAFIPEGDEARWGPGRDSGRWAPGEWTARKEGEDKKRLAPGIDETDPDRDLWSPGLAASPGWNEKDPKKGRKDSSKDSKKGKKGSKKDKDKKGLDKSESFKAPEKEEDQKDKKDKKKDKDGDKEKKGGLFSKFRKPKDSKSKVAVDEPSSPTEYGPGGASQPGQGPGDQGSAYPGYGAAYPPGLGVGAGDLSGVVGDETWIDNKMTFEPVLPPKKETKETLKSRADESDYTMPFFSPAATSTVGRPGKVPPPVPPKSPRSPSFDDSFSRKDPPTVATESVQYQPDLEEVPVPTKNVPLVKTETRTVTYEREGFPFDSEEDGVLVSARSHSTRMQTIETTTYKTEKDGIQETRVEHKVVLSSTDDDFDYDAALADAIRSVTEFNPDMSVERIECVQQIEEVKNK